MEYLVSLCKLLHIRSSNNKKSNTVAGIVTTVVMQNSAVAIPSFIRTCASKWPSVYEPTCRGFKRKYASACLNSQSSVSILAKGGYGLKLGWGGPMGDLQGSRGDLQGVAWRSHPSDRLLQSAVREL